LVPEKENAWNIKVRTKARDKVMRGKEKSTTFEGLSRDTRGVLTIPGG